MEIKRERDRTALWPGAVCLPVNLLPTPEGVNKGGRWVEGQVAVWHSLYGLTLHFCEIKNPSPIYS